MKKKNAQTGSTIFMITLVLAVLVAFSLVILSPQQPKPNYRNPRLTDSSESEAGVITSFQATATALPDNYPNLIPDYFDNQNETDGVILGGGILILIIILGVFVSKRNNEK